MSTVLRAWADDAAEMARVISAQDPTWGSETFPLADGRAVLWGPGLYVNRAMAAGLSEPLTDADVDELEARSAAVGVPAAVEVSPATTPQTSQLLAARGYGEIGDRRVSALRYVFGGRSDEEIDVTAPSDAAWKVEPADDQVTTWQETSAAGWGHRSSAARRASDAFALAAAAIDGTTLLLVRDQHSLDPVGCASLTIHDGVATLGGMTTVQTMRGRGIQAVAIHERLRVAALAGCSVATTTVAAGSDSERNLHRNGFQPWFEIRTLSLDRGSEPSQH